MLIFFFNLMCSLAQAAFSNNVLDLGVLLIFAGWWQLGDLKRKIEVTEMSLVLRISQMHHHYCVSEQHRRNDHRGDGLDNY